MSDYRRYRVPGGTYFFTVNLLERYANDLLTRHVDILREVVRETRHRRPFHIDAWVVLPEHLHCVWTLPPGDVDNANRWRIIKQQFSKALPVTERRSAVRIARGERGIWQRRFWDHVIGMMRITPHISTIAISIRSSMAWSNMWRIGLTQLSIGMSSRGYIQRIGRRHPVLTSLTASANKIG